MQYIIDHDYHIHSTVSGCCYDPNQTPENILKCAEEHGLSKIVLTDHFWDRSSVGDENCAWRQYECSSFESLSKALPLPQSDKVEFVFGCEADIDEKYNIGIHESRYDTFGFIVIPTTHFHFWYGNDVGIAERAKLYVKRFEAVLESSLPFKKVGIAHLTCPLVANFAPDAHIAVINSISDADFETLFKGASEKGCGIELNFNRSYNDEDYEKILRPYLIAKDCGCKFYIGSDSHALASFDPYLELAANVARSLNLCEDDKFHF